MPRTTRPRRTPSTRLSNILVSADHIYLSHVANRGAQRHSHAKKFFNLENNKKYIVAYAYELSFSTTCPFLPLCLVGTGSRYRDVLQSLRRAAEAVISQKKTQENTIKQPFLKKTDNQVASQPTDHTPSELGAHSRYPYEERCISAIDFF